MNLEKYNYLVDKSFLEYKFYSRGINGKITKFVSLALQNQEGKTFLTLTFGDYREKTGEMDTLSISDNGDTEKILATVFSILVEFLSRFPDMLVYAIGSTVSRTRLYRMGINKYWNDIHPLLWVYGQYDGHWEPFEKNKRYEAFLFAKG